LIRRKGKIPGIQNLDVLENNRLHIELGQN
jgi:hypothetical protein